MTLGGPLASLGGMARMEKHPQTEAVGCIVVEFRIIRWELRFNLKEE
jgi:hypothetical protein